MDPAIMWTENMGKLFLFGDTEQCAYLQNYAGRSTYNCHLMTVQSYTGHEKCAHKASHFGCLTSSLLL